ncbi:hypothetical protein GCM10011581_49800 [Saccharopolyspora subtropica]|uniref:Cell wall synthesis protein Wag31 n=1 Tax=Saccharopolyspora thermophila TaxID=89367 RepID=A0A917KBE9_9PSEU|nr:DivIVA domain-containing protein [Saccharopolyspora subtropica]GGJ06900.1 hypothetical protein GCM10011581_49800 [Saccharopolyspora subtropica]
MLTPDDVHNVAFSRTWRRHRGFDQTEVDEFLGRVEATLRGKPLLTARDVLTARFSPGKPGRAYNKTQVAEFLDQVALTLMKREVRQSERSDRRQREVARTEKAVSRPHGAVPPPRPEPPEPVGRFVAPEPVDVAGNPATQQAALDKAEVDAFMDRVEATLRGADSLTAQDVLSVRFNPPAPGKPGYQEASVLAFLVMVATIIKNMAPTQRALPTQRAPIARAFQRTPRRETPNWPSGRPVPSATPTTNDR